MKDSKKEFEEEDGKELEDREDRKELEDKTQEESEAVEREPGKAREDEPEEEEGRKKSSVGSDLEDLAGEDDEKGAFELHRLHDTSYQPKLQSHSNFSGFGQGNFNVRDNGYRTNRNSKVYFLILVVIGLLVVGGAVYLLKNQLSTTAPAPSPSPLVIITSPSPSPSLVSLDRSKYTIRVLNGTDKAGLAASVSAKLKSLGYQTDQFGNATNSAFLRTVVRVKTAVSDLANQLVRDLSPQFDATVSSNLKSSDQADAEIILGQK